MKSFAVLPRIKSALERARARRRHAVGIELGDDAYTLLLAELKLSEEEAFARGLEIEGVPVARYPRRRRAYAGFVKFAGAWGGEPIQTFPFAELLADLFCPKCGVRGKLISEGAELDVDEPRSVRALCAACHCQWTASGLIHWTPTESSLLELIEVARERSILPDISPRQTVETGWLIERAGDERPDFWTPAGWTFHAAEALRFARKADAEAMIEAADLRSQARRSEDVFASEHQWSSS